MKHPASWSGQKEVAIHTSHAIVISCHVLYVNTHIQILSTSKHNVTVITLHIVTGGKVIDFIVVDKMKIRSHDLGVANAVKDVEM